jgi:hypothetical protein
MKQRTLFTLYFLIMLTFIFSALFDIFRTMADGLSIDDQREFHSSQQRLRNSAPSTDPIAEYDEDADPNALAVRPENHLRSVDDEMSDYGDDSDEEY